jgi:hypothetical protein
MARPSATRAISEPLCESTGFTNTHLMRMAGRFARRVKAWGAANGVPVIFCKAGERKHRIAEAYLAGHEVGVGVFLVLVAKAPAPVWKVARSSKTAATASDQSSATGQLVGRWSADVSPQGRWEPTVNVPCK